MKQSIAVVLFLVLIAGGASAQDAGKKTFTLDAGAGLSFGLFDSVPSSFGDLSGLATLASVRGGADITFLYKINDFIGVGPFLGIYYLTYTPSGGSSYTFFDIPLRAAVKVGTGTTFIEPFVGYYLAPVGFPFPGLEFGARGSLGGFFVEASYVAGTPTWKHVNVGIDVADIFGF